MVFLVKRIVNRPIDSNSYVLYKQDSSTCIVVDPGTEDCKELLQFLNEHNLKPIYIILTHEHFDHIWGVNKLKKIFNCEIVCSNDCAEKIVDRKKNMSIFYNQIGFITYPANIITEDINNILKLNNIEIQFFKTPGHTDGSICVFVDKKLFTGDTIIKDIKTVIKLPGGSKEKLKNTLNFIYRKFGDKQIKVFPGHGDCFFIKEINIKELI